MSNPRYQSNYNYLETPTYVLNFLNPLTSRSNIGLQSFILSLSTNTLFTSLSPSVNCQHFQETDAQ